MKSAPRARRPQPEIREQKTARNDAAGLRAKPSSAPVNQRRAGPSADEWQARQPKQAAKPAGQGKSRGQSRDASDEWTTTRPPRDAKVIRAAISNGMTRS